MRPKTITLTGSGSGTTNSNPLRVDWRNSDISLQLITDGSTTGFTAQYTMEPPAAHASLAAWASAATWMSHSELTGVTANDDGGIDKPVQGIRLQADANGTDVGQLIVTQNMKS